MRSACIAIAAASLLSCERSSGPAASTATPVPAIAVPGATRVPEVELASCRVDADCVAVRYAHCCGSSHRGIHVRWKDRWAVQPEWQVYNEPDCAVIGQCPPETDAPWRAICDQGYCRAIQ